MLTTRWQTICNCNPVNDTNRNMSTKLHVDDATARMDMCKLQDQNRIFIASAAVMNTEICVPQNLLPSSKFGFMASATIILHPFSPVPSICGLSNIGI